MGFKIDHIPYSGRWVGKDHIKSDTAAPAGSGRLANHYISEAGARLPGRSLGEAWRRQTDLILCPFPWGDSAGGLPLNP